MKLTPYDTRTPWALCVDDRLFEMVIDGAVEWLHIEEQEPGVWRLNRHAPGQPGWWGPSFATPEECALYGLMVGNLE